MSRILGRTDEKLFDIFGSAFWGQGQWEKLEKFLKGGEGKGLTVRPLETSSAKFAETTPGFREAVGKFFENRGPLGPE